MAGTALFFHVFIDPLLVTELSRYDILVPQTSCDNSLRGNCRLVAPSKGESMLITSTFTFMCTSIDGMLAFISNPFDKKKEYQLLSFKARKKIMGVNLGGDLVLREESKEGE